MTKNTYKHVVAVLELLCHRNANIRAAFKDSAKLDQLANDIVAVHPELREYFSTIGFHSSLSPIPPSLSPEVDVHTVCGPTPTVRIPTHRGGGIVFKAAVDATRLLQNSGYSCAIFGSAACYLYGNTRHPNDVDILVSSSENAELIKLCLVNQDPMHFYLKKARKPEAKYQVLRYKRRLTIGQWKVRKDIKVDILTPGGKMMLPFLSSRSAIVKNGLPLVPLEVLLLHKLQGWHHHIKAREWYKRKKQTADVADIRCILKIVLRSLTGNERSWASVALSCFQKRFRRLTVQRVKKFCSNFSDCRDDWYQLGFEVA
ncbi:hypothetical protein EDD18DRAFT_1080231 [Armillaria luteobubalina]|uniref:Uncharacterized protein n=1 Tax=Armillaria luteobubalina TaxID=153913 RepID=A0AA39UKR5_9AGAR|nr:hypothetical protein EDD18DRAFT_1080231 [Armillaria luteobubalina]